VIELVGFMTLWLIGGALLFYVPLRTSGWWANTGEGIGDMILGLWAGLVLLVLYILATVVYFMSQV
jgi:hypothetical protein